MAANIIFPIDDDIWMYSGNSEYVGNEQGWLDSGTISYDLDNSVGTKMLSRNVSRSYTFKLKGTTSNIRVSMAITYDDGTGTAESSENISIPIKLSAQGAVVEITTRGGTFLEAPGSFVITLHSLAGEAPAVVYGVMLIDNEQDMEIEYIEKIQNSVQRNTSYNKVFISPAYGIRTYDAVNEGASTLRSTIAAGEIKMESRANTGSSWETALHFDAAAGKFVFNGKIEAIAGNIAEFYIHNDRLTSSKNVTVSGVVYIHQATMRPDRIDHMKSNSVNGTFSYVKVGEMEWVPIDASGAGIPTRTVSTGVRLIDTYTGNVRWLDIVPGMLESPHGLLRGNWTLDRASNGVDSQIITYKDLQSYGLV